MLKNDKERNLHSLDYDEVTDISESLSEANFIKRTNSEIKSVSKSNTSKTKPTMNSLKMTRNDIDPNQDDEEISLIQENEPVTTFTNEEDEDEAVVEPIEEDVEVIQADEDIPDAEIEDLNPQGPSSPPLHLSSGPLPKLSLSDNQDTQFPDNSDDISFNIADEQLDEEMLDDDNFKPDDTRSTMGPMEGPHALPNPNAESPGGDEDEDDDDDDDVQAPLPEGSYDPADYDDLDVPPELKELFTYISSYTPQNIELEHKLRPYIPDYIPAVGDIDAFIKIPRPDEDPSTIGLTVLDEPSAKQSDSTVLDLQLRAVAKHTTARAVVVKTVENAEKNSKVIEKWMRDISDLHRAKPPPTVHYAKQMPDIDSLMQEWPGEIEELMKEINLPSAALQVELPHYVDLICSILDIPVYKSRIQSLHVFFTLFSVFRNSANFRHLAEENAMENEPDSGGAEHLVLN